MSKKTIPFECPCGRKVRAPLRAAGRKARCPQCDRRLRVPELEEVQGRPDRVVAELYQDDKKPSDSTAPYPTVTSPAEPAPDPIEPGTLKAAIRDLEQGDLDSARETLEELLAENPSDGDIHLCLGRCFEKQGEFQEAWQSYRSADVVGIGEAGSYLAALAEGPLLDRANALIHQGSYVEARGVAEQCLGIVPQSSKVRRVLVESLSRQVPEDPDTVRRALEELRPRVQSDYELVTGMADLQREMGDVQAALADLEGWLSLPGGDDRQECGVRGRVARLRLELGDVEGAIAQLEPMGCAAPEEEVVSLREQIIVAREDLEDFDGALADLDLLRDRFGERDRWTLLSARLHAKVGRFEESIQGYESLLSAHPGDMNLMVNLANCYFLQKDYAKAIEMFGEVLDRNPLDRQARLNRSACYRLIRPSQHGLARADLDQLFALTS